MAAKLVIHVSVNLKKSFLIFQNKHDRHLRSSPFFIIDNKLSIPVSDRLRRASLPVQVGFCPRQTLNKDKTGHGRQTAITKKGVSTVQMS